jgi:hypothetical protein
MTFKRRKRLGNGKYRISQVKQSLGNSKDIEPKVDEGGSKMATSATSFETEEAGHPKPPPPHC